MKIKNISISNFRKIKEPVYMDIDYETLIVGKNNTAKTSIFEIINKFINNYKFKLEDFNNEIINHIYLEAILSRYRDDLNEEEFNKILKAFPFISMDISIIVEENDNLATVRDLLYEFDNNDEIIIKCIYSLDDLKKIMSEFKKYNSSFNSKEQHISFRIFFERKFQTFYSKKYFSTKPNSTYLNSISEEFVKSMFNIHTMAAQREVDDTSEQEKLTLSNAIWKFYEKKKKENVNDLDNDDIFKEVILNIKERLNESYHNYFSDLITNLNANIMKDDKKRELGIVSDFDIESILKKNSKIKYFLEGDVSLSESYNGLGYSNLLYIFIQIEAYKFEMLANGAIFNILLIEEPESHLHPQMQSIFLKKISEALKDTENVYRIITTHSSYVLQSSCIDNIRYFLSKDNGLEIKSLSAFMNIEQNKNLSNVIHKYFRINTCDLFFADKVIFVEGSVERILMPSIFQTLDLANTDNYIGAQHISIFEVGGTYAHVFQDLVDFLEVKSLTITDIDSVEGSHNSVIACDITQEPKDNLPESPYKVKTINGNITNWFTPKVSPLFIKNIINEYMTLDSRIKKISIKDNDGNIIGTKETKALIVFQLPLKGEEKWGRTFEEQFIIENSVWLKTNIPNFTSLKSAIGDAKNENNKSLNLNEKTITEEQLKKNYYFIVQKLDKTEFALELISHHGWVIPNYIKEGLEWLKN